jgi:hypothetical protein
MTWRIEEVCGQPGCAWYYDGLSYSCMSLEHPRIVLHGYALIDRMRPSAGRLSGRYVDVCRWCEMHQSEHVANGACLLRVTRFRNDIV